MLGYCVSDPVLATVGVACLDLPVPGDTVVSILTVDREGNGGGSSSRRIMIFDQTGESTKYRG